MQGRRQFVSARAAATAAMLIALGFLVATPARAQVLPSPWASTDIGNPPAAGSASESAGRFTIQASGADIWGTSDQFHFLYQQVSGDVDVIARIDSVTNANAWSKAGVMIRSSLTSGASHAFAVASAAKGLAFQRRRTNGAISYNTSGTLTAPPRWTRLVRRGTQVTAYVSADGVTWTSLGSDTIALGTVAYVGIAATSHASALTTAVASQVAVYPLSLPAGYAASDVGGPTPAGNAVYRNGVFTLSGAGADIWDTHDEFRYVYKQVTGDVDIRARVTSVQYRNKWTKAGVMIREALTDNARHGSALLSAGMGYVFQRRADAGGLSASTAGGSGQAPGWVRVVRTGTQIDAYRSADGATWTLMGSDTITMGASVYVGLVVSSHVTGTLADGVFDNVKITQTGTGTNVPPTVTLTAPASGATFTAPASTTVSATATDSDGQISRVDFLANNTVIGTDSTAPYSISWSNVPAGTYAVTAIAYDNGGASKESAPASVTVTGTTNKPPTVLLTSPANGATFTPGSTLTMSANASDPEGALARVDFYANGQLAGSDTTAPYSLSSPNIPAGTYSIYAVARDTAGATATSATATVTFTTATTNKPPTVSLTAPASGAAFVAPATITVSANASDPEGALSKVDFYANGSLIGSDTTAPYSISWAGVAAGSYSLTAVARDAAGNATTSAAVSITVSGSTGTGSWSVAFTASPDHASVTRYVLEIFASGANPATATPIATSDLGKPTPDANNNITLDRTTFFNGLAAGTYVSTVRAENSAGVSRSTPVTFTR
jgi:regulation of enolase protein 1 (concanavalin A-like superfamily)